MMQSPPQVNSLLPSGEQIPAEVNIGFSLHDYSIQEQLLKSIAAVLAVHACM